MRLEENMGSTGTMANAVAAAIMPYSIAVAPDSSLKNFNISCLLDCGEFPTASDLSVGLAINKRTHNN